MPSLHYTLVRAILRHKKLYNEVLLPYFATLHPYGVRHVVRHYQCLFPYVLDPSGGNLLKLEESIQKAVHSGEKASLAFDALNWLSWMERRCASVSTDVLHNADYRFVVGEICEVAGTRERAVIAVRFPVFLTEDKNPKAGNFEWLDMPWYIVLPPYNGQNRKNGEKLIPELLLRKVQHPASVGYNPRLPVFFEGYDMNKSLYVPRKSIGEAETMTTQVYV
ncbi:hypothetical protein DQ04_02271100 [Trypanosoma grayi]|uniref:hypothetical protein n=1 Tax=Trypanosoma grayi TaxID=71804 RepID=UPI0004F43BFD|nr:hypothetical protein DQ04_02271100 [Trypanosoma grayi]KEG11800.1 hypothetical protein DQ04_02271100 [Trypanosoma grayi]